MGHREVPLDEKQKAELLSFVRDDGKGFVAAHVGLTALESWPEFGELLGARFDGHPVVGPGVVVNEDPSFPGDQAFSRALRLQRRVLPAEGVLARQGARAAAARSLERAGDPGAASPDRDYPLAWAKMYGKGRVFYGSFAHASSTWDIRDVQQMYLEAIKWSLGMTNADLKPHPMTSIGTEPVR